MKKTKSKTACSGPGVTLSPAKQAVAESMRRSARLKCASAPEASRTSGHCAEGPAPEAAQRLLAAAAAMSRQDLELFSSQVLGLLASKDNIPEASPEEPAAVPSVGSVLDVSAAATFPTTTGADTSSCKSVATASPSYAAVSAGLSARGSFPTPPSSTTRRTEPVTPLSTVFTKKAQRVVRAAAAASQQKADEYAAVPSPRTQSRSQPLVSPFRMRKKLSNPIPLSDSDEDAATQATDYDAAPDPAARGAPPTPTNARLGPTDESQKSDHRRPRSTTFHARVHPGSAPGNVMSQSLGTQVSNRFGLLADDETDLPVIPTAGDAPPSPLIPAGSTSLPSRGAGAQRFEVKSITYKGRSPLSVQLQRCAASWSAPTSPSSPSRHPLRAPQEPLSPLCWTRRGDEVVATTPRALVRQSARQGAVRAVLSPRAKTNPIEPSTPVSPSGSGASSLTAGSPSSTHNGKDLIDLSESDDEGGGAAGFASPDASHKRKKRAPATPAKSSTSSPTKAPKDGAADSQAELRCLLSELSRTSYYGSSALLPLYRLDCEPTPLHGIDVIAISVSTDGLASVCPLEAACGFATPARPNALYIFHSRMSSEESHPFHWEVVRSRQPGGGWRYVFPKDLQQTELSFDPYCAAAMQACTRRVLTTGRAPRAKIDTWGPPFYQSMDTSAFASSFEVEDTRTDGSCFFSSLEKAVGWNVKQQKEAIHRVAVRHPEAVVRELRGANSVYRDCRAFLEGKSSASSKPKPISPMAKSSASSSSALCGGKKPNLVSPNNTSKPGSSAATSLPADATSKPSPASSKGVGATQRTRKPSRKKHARGPVKANSGHKSPDASGGTVAAADSQPKGTTAPAAANGRSNRTGKAHPNPAVVAWGIARKVSSTEELVQLARRRGADHSVTQLLSKVSAVFVSNERNPGSFHHTIVFDSETDRTAALESTGLKAALRWRAERLRLRPDRPGKTAESSPASALAPTAACTSSTTAPSNDVQLKAATSPSPGPTDMALILKQLELMSAAIQKLSDVMGTRVTIANDSFVDPGTDSRRPPPPSPAHAPSGLQWLGHQAAPVAPPPPICWSVRSGGPCPYGDKCRYGHLPLWSNDLLGATRLQPQDGSALLALLETALTRVLLPAASPAVPPPPAAAH
jgi:hypothetical protein